MLLVLLLLPPVCCKGVGGGPPVDSVDLVGPLVTAAVQVTGTNTVFCGHKQVGEAVLGCVVVLAVVVVVVVGVVEVVVLVVVEVD